MTAPNLSTVLSTPNGRHVVHQTTDSAVAAALVRAEPDRRGIERKQSEQ